MTEKIDVLSHHDAICEFAGIRHIPCRFRTALCPDRCDHASDVAIFNVLEYKNYELKGKYGDEKQEQITCEVKKPVYHQDPAIAEKCKSLKPGQKVEVVYDHLYVDDGQNARPERPIISITEV